jgi:hypothetical protein
MKLLTRELEKHLPPLYSHEDVEDPLVLAHFFNPSGQGDWWITEGSREDEDYLMFGLCSIFEPELGYVSMNELQSARGPLGLGIERDLNWTPKRLSEVRAQAVTP